MNRTKRIFLISGVAAIALGFLLIFYVDPLVGEAWVIGAVLGTAFSWYRFRKDEKKGK